ncbi:hypothetical protein IFM89_015628 [Coptis chinensis]|uniref:F-box domain-containing protein n=1 Tax=Coptis chinensis TaxID=261450 RepID=A0A835IE81_9MAGN|nr:hypothetical protein IFM89_015628 [Coptis chinensis]
MDQGLHVHLPQEIIYKVLLRIPAEFLNTLKCVCKLWFDLISSHKFVDAHVTRHAGDLAQILVCRDSKLGPLKREYEIVSIQDIKNTRFQLQHHQLEVLLNDEIYLQSSCDGLLLFESRNKEYQLYVCNPITRKCSVLPLLKKTVLNLEWTLVHDGSTCKYKVVGLSTDTPRCFVFTLHGNHTKKTTTTTTTPTCWRELSMPYQDSLFLSPLTLLKNELHWLAKFPGKEQDILYLFSMDIAKKNFRDIQVPISSRRPWNKIIEVKGSLCLTDYCECSNQLDIWTLEAEASIWIKNYSINLKLSGPVTLCSYPSSTYSCETRVLIWRKNQIFVFDLENSSLERIDIPTEEGMRVRHNIVHISSLVKWE